MATGIRLTGNCVLTERVQNVVTITKRSTRAADLAGIKWQADRGGLISLDVTWIGPPLTDVQWRNSFHHEDAGLYRDIHSQHLLHAAH